MKRLPKEKRDRLILIFLGALAITVGLYYGVIGSQRKALLASARLLTEKRNQLNNAERLISNLPQVKSNLEDTLGRLRAIEATMASGDLYSWGILTVNSFKENYDIDIPQFSREIPAEVGMYPLFPYKAAIFNLRGSAFYHDFGRFVADFENAFPFMRIQNIELEPSNSSNASNQEGSEKLSFRLEIVALVNPLR
jgi:hypothetical protein